MDLVAPIAITPNRKRRRWWEWTGLAIAAWIVGTIAGVIPGCLVPPVILEGGEKTLRIDSERFPPGTELVEIPLASGEKLRGVFVPSKPGAPVVLHLLESSGSVASKGNSYGGLLAGLADCGFASLMVDYRGVGASEGSRSPRHLEEDARTMWEEALHRTGGDPGLVVVRGISIGSLAAASLADRGANPAAWILLAPVRAETVVRNFAQWQYPGILSRLASSFFRPPSSTDLVASVDRMRSRLWVVAARGDELLLEPEQIELRKAVESAGGTWGRVGDPRARSARAAADHNPKPAGGVFSMAHMFASLEAHCLLEPDEPILLGSLVRDWPDRDSCGLEALSALPPDVAARFERGSPARDRLERLAAMLSKGDARRIAAVALAFEDLGVARKILLVDRHLRTGWASDLDLADTLRVLDLADPAGKISESLLLEWTRTLSVIRSQGAEAACYLDPAHILDLARSGELEYAAGNDRTHEVLRLQGWFRSTYPCCALWRTLLVDRELTKSDARRQATRILLKAAGIPDRIVRDPDGQVRLEIRECGSWMPVDLEGPPPDPPDPPGAAAALPR